MANNPSSQKGARAEREAAELVTDLLGYVTKRRYNIGTHEDIGDLVGIPDLCIQVCHRATDVVSVGVVRKPLEVEQQAIHMGVPHGVVLLKAGRPGQWRFVMTPQEFKKLYDRGMPF
jgi:hypothetical protein